MASPPSLPSRPGTTFGGGTSRWREGTIPTWSTGLDQLPIRPGSGPARRLGTCCCCWDGTATGTGGGRWGRSHRSWSGREGDGDGDGDGSEDGEGGVAGSEDGTVRGGISPPHPPAAYGGAEPCPQGPSAGVPDRGGPGRGPAPVPGTDGRRGRGDGGEGPAPNNCKGLNLVSATAMQKQFYK